MGNLCKIKSAVILGGAISVWRDLDSLIELVGADGWDSTFAINNAVADYDGRIDYAVSLHANKFDLWMGEREKRELEPPHNFFGHSGKVKPRNYDLTDVFDYKWPEQHGSGSSGLFAVRIALELGYNRIALCGVPMQSAEAHYWQKSRAWEIGERYQRDWEATKHRFENQVRSMSGWTRDLLGPPNADWFDD